MKLNYEELEARCAALATELSAVEAIHNEAVFITDEHYEQCPPEVQKIIRSLAVMQIPAYQAFLAEVRAQGVESAGEYLKQYAQGLHEEARLVLQDASELCNGFAAQLRKGVQS